MSTRPVARLSSLLTRWPRLPLSHPRATPVHFSPNSSLPHPSHPFSTSHAPNMAAPSSRLANRTILITGASSGIGQATATEFARSAAGQPLRLILTARRLERVQAFASALQAQHGAALRILPAQLDMTDIPAVSRFVAQLPAEWQGIDCLVNNAGMVLGKDKVGDMQDADVLTMLSTNVTGLVALTQKVVALYKSRAPPADVNAAAFPDTSAPYGDVVNIGSIAGRDPYPMGSIYCGTKAFVRTFSESLRKELVDTRIRVLEIDPGQVETEFSVVRYRGDQARADGEYKGVEPLTAEDIAEVIVFGVGRRQNVVLADTLIFPSHQAGAGIMHRKG